MIGPLRSVPRRVWQVLGAFAVISLCSAYYMPVDVYLITLTAILVLCAALVNTEDTW